LSITLQEIPEKINSRICLVCSGYNYSKGNSDLE